MEDYRDHEDWEEEIITRTINIIADGFAGGSTTKSAHKKHPQEVLSLFAAKMKMIHKPSSTPKIVFTSYDLEGVVLGYDDPMIISAKMVNAEVKQVFIDQGSSANIIFQEAFDKLGLKNLDL